MKATFVSVLALAAVLVLWAPEASADQVGTAFTYQGRLNDGGVPVNGDANLRFRLYDGATGGGLKGSFGPVLVSVVEGLFTQKIDFDVSPWVANQARWLEIDVEFPPGSGFVTLTPRQELTPTPFSLATRGINVDADGNVGIGTRRPGQGLALDVDGDAHVRGSLKIGEGTIVINDPTDTITATSGKITFDLDTLHVVGTENNGSTAALKITSPFWGQVMLLDGNEIDALASGLFLNNNTDQDVVLAMGGGNVGVGTIDPQAKLDVRADSTGVKSLADLGIAVWGESRTDYGVFGRTASTEALAAGVFGSTSGALGSASGVRGSSFNDKGKGVYGHVYHSSGVNYGVYGRSDSPNGYDFYAGGAGVNYGASSSRRWKSNIEPIDGPLDKVAQLRGVYFDWDAEHGGHHDVGMIAEEVGKILPEIVSFEENGIDASGMDYSKLTPLLVEAINALRTEKDRQLAEKDDEIRELRAGNADFESRLADLEATMAQFATQLTAQQEDEQ